MVKGIKTHFEIEWRETRWIDLEKPFYSGLAARLYLASIEGTKPIPETVETQAAFWRTFFPNGQNSSRKFIDDVTELENKAPCRGQLNVLVVLDGSNKIGLDDFEEAKTSVAFLMSLLSLKRTNIGFVVYGYNFHVQFPLDNRFSTESRKAAVLGTSFPGGAPYAYAGIGEAIKMLLEADERSPNQTSIPKVMIVFTAGKSVYEPRTYNTARKATQSGITSFSVRITNSSNQHELKYIANGREEQIFNLTQLEDLVELAYKLNYKFENCSKPQQASINSTTEGNLEEGERIYYRVQYPREFGCTVTFAFEEGSGNIYWSRSVQNPSSALHDGKFLDGTQFIPPAQLEVEDEFEFYLTVLGLEEVNSFSVEIEEGDTAPTTIGHVLQTASSGWKDIYWVIAGGTALVMLILVIVAVICFRVYANRKTKVENACTHELEKLNKY